jgi:uncharacterized cupin superfamily protein
MSIVKPVMNIDDVQLRDSAHGDAFAAKVGSFGDRIGSTGIGCMLHIVEPGKAAFPLHVHHVNDELFVILEGAGSYQYGAEHYPVRAGDVLAAPAGGPEVAHKITNTGDTPLKYLGISTKKGTEVVEYPDSKKFAVMSRFDWSNPQAGGIRYVGRRESAVDYWDGE